MLERGKKKMKRMGKGKGEGELGRGRWRKEKRGNCSQNLDKMMGGGERGFKQKLNIERIPILK